MFIVVQPSIMNFWQMANGDNLRTEGVGGSQRARDSGAFLRD